MPFNIFGENKLFGYQLLSSAFSEYTLSGLISFLQSFNRMKL